jgi:hypothetical protein
MNVQQHGISDLYVKVCMDYIYDKQRSLYLKYTGFTYLLVNDVKMYMEGMQGI